ncbi:hypothetical protein ACFQMM_19275 [Saliphagus sp. GCM10025308]
MKATQAARQNTVWELGLPRNLVTDYLTVRIALSPVGFREHLCVINDNMGSMSCGNLNISADESQMTVREKLESDEALTDTDRAFLVELLNDRDLLEKMVVGHVQALLSGRDGVEVEEENSFSFPPRPDDWESERDAFEFPSRSGETGH